MPKKQRKHTDASKEPYLSLNIHFTAEVLLQKRSARVWARLEVMHFSASQLGTRPASSISFMVRVPGVKISFTVCGHSINQIIGTIVLRLDVQTPTMPITQLSEYMTQFGIFLTSWQT